MGTYVLLLLLFVGCYEVLLPRTGVGEQIHNDLKNVPYALEVLSWGPLTLLLVGGIELCETMVGLFLFRAKWVERNRSEEI